MSEKKFTASAIVPSESEVQRAHKLLISVILYQELMGFTEEQFADILAYASVLCWLLGHDHNPTFPCNLAVIEERMQQKGLLLTGDTLYRGEGRVQ